MGWSNKSRFSLIHKVKKCECEERHEQDFLLGTNIQDKVMRMRKPTATPIVAAVPTWPSIARPVKAPINNVIAAISR